MKASELEIGNLISFKGIWDGEVESINKDTVDIRGNNGVFSHDVFKPIPLTEEWLVKLGFNLLNRNVEINPYEKNEWIYSIGEDRQVQVKLIKEWYGSTEDTPYYYIQFYWYDNSIKSLKYVHQLQNLYFALTGEEL